MNKDYYINNFKVFDNEGAYIDIRPITILTGCNNSGKSSIVKSLCLLNDFCRQADICLSKSGITDLAKIKLDFHKSPNDIMGSFSKVIHKAEPIAGNDNNAEANENKSFSLKASAYSNYFLQNMFVELTFSNRKEDHLDNGYLTKIEISTTDNEVVYSSEIGGEHMYNFDSLKKHLIIAILVNRFIADFHTQYLHQYAEENQFTNHNRLESSIKSFQESLRIILDNYPEYICSNILRWCTTQSVDENSIKRSLKSPILKSELITTKLFKASELNIFSYFPFMWEHKNLSIQELRNLFTEGLTAVSCEPHEIELVNKLFQDVEDSESKDLFEYIRNEEKHLFNISLPSFLVGPSFFEPRYPSNKRDYVFDGESYTDVLQYGQIIYALNKINQVLSGDKNSYITDCISDFRYFINVKDILTLAITDILQNILPGNLLYSRTEGVSVKRLYSLESGSDFAELIKDFFNKSWLLSKYSKKVSFDHIPAKDYQPGTFLNKWVNELGLAHRASITSVADGLGASIRMYSSENDTEGTLLADMGYGSTQLFMTILKIENAIMDSVKMFNCNRIITSGFNQELIDFIESYSYLLNNPITVALEEPENHLHPSLQSKLADMLVDADSNYGVQFLIETHSEYLIRKLQLLIARKTVDNDHVSILYINSKDRPSYMPLVNRIGVDSEGNLEDVFGPGFFDESIRLTKELIKANIKDDEEQN